MWKIRFVTVLLIVQGGRSSLFDNTDDPECDGVVCVTTTTFRYCKGTKQRDMMGDMLMTCDKGLVCVGPMRSSCGYPNPTTIASPPPPPVTYRPTTPKLVTTEKVKIVPATMKKKIKKCKVRPFIPPTKYLPQARELTIKTPKH